MQFFNIIWIITFIINIYNVNGVHTDCEQPPSIHHGNAKLTEDDDGDLVKATYYCENGFKLKGKAELKCDLDTDEWKGEPPACEQDSKSSTSGEYSSSENRRRNPKGRQNIEEETGINNEFAKDLDLSCIGRKTPPSIENASILKYNRRKKNGNIFLVAFYECNDEYEFEVPEIDRLYCSKENWLGTRPVCVAIEYDENENDEDDEDYGDEDDENYNEEDEDEDEDNNEDDDDDGGGEDDDVDEGDNNDNGNNNKIDKTTESVSAAAPEILNEKNEIETDRTEIHQQRNEIKNSKEIKIECGPDRGGCDHECQMTRNDGEIDSYVQCSCYSGFMLDESDGRRCHDINECENGNGGCEQNCNNTPGSYECSCLDGLQIDTTNGKYCIDINECLLRNGHGPCQDTCLNTWGSYYCTCDGLPGTKLSQNNHDCEDAGNCSINNGGCSHKCLTTYGRVHCLCDSGYILGDDWKTCKDINECEDPEIKCSHGCENTIGSYHCLNATIQTAATDNDIINENLETNEIIGGHGDMIKEDHDDGDNDDDDGDDDNDDENEDEKDDENEEDNSILTNNSVMKTCGDGLHLNEQNQCEDIDECAEGNTGCEYCTNVYGGYECTCPDGYDLMDDEKHCQDINECELYADYDENDSRESLSGAICSHECFNVRGSYECKCPDNFHLQYDRRTCTRDFCDDLKTIANKIKCSHDCYDDKDGYVCKCPNGYNLDSDFKTCIPLDEVLHPQQQWCNPNINNPCEPGECINITHGYTCECPEGYQSTMDNRCEDINECEQQHEHRHRCSHTCLNTDGSYECSCPDGYVLDEDEINCKQSDLCKENNGGCSHICLENRCECPDGYTLDTIDGKSCYDIDECFINNGGCQHRCHNVDGSFSCSCEIGYELIKETNSCIDINECTGDDICEHHCVNTEGSYRCTCQDGFQIGPDKKQCIDINECEYDNGNCSHICINLLGNFQCSCPSGQYLVNDDSTCEFVNECEINNGGCSHECKYFEGSVFCNCPSGYELEKNRKNCIDIDECQLSNGDCSHICKNFNGHHICECEAGYQLGSDQRSCIDIDECIEENGNCSNICVNLLGSYTCTCESGFELHPHDKHTCIDINECHEEIHDCSHECINVPGTYECNCPIGYKLGRDHFTCEDINECSEIDVCSENCVNTLGSYFCTCPDGHKLDPIDNKTCIDINECEENDDNDNEINDTTLKRCSHDCKNTIGSYQCLCPIGLRLSSDVLTCIDIDECNDSHQSNGGCSQLCENFEGSYRCKCLTGYELDDDHLTCRDIDECRQNNGDCEQICVNTEGSHYCSCHPDLLLKSDGRHCQSTNPCHHNNGGCEHNCESGYGSEPICTCNKGFQLNIDNNKTCVDIDECKLNKMQQYCQHICTNTIGSYRCDCPKGHRMNEHNQCIDIDECHYLNGGCPKDAKCINLVGGHRCLCAGGFKLSNDRRTCVEIKDNCKPIRSPRNGELRCTRSRHRTQLFYKTKCTVKCHKGYKLVGPPVKHCNGSGHWDDEGEPLCVPQSCPRIPRPEHGMISPTNCMLGKLFAGERCILHCPAGYKPVSQRTAVCDTEQNWIPNSNLYCIPIDMVTQRTIQTAVATPATISKTDVSEKYIKPFIKCPQDTTIILPKNQKTVYIKLEQPKTNVDWWRYIDSHPAWGKHLEARLAPGEHVITFRARSPNSNVNVVCRTIITVKESQPPKVVFCPQSIEYQLQPYETSRAVYWKEPVFRSPGHLKAIFKSKIPGDSLNIGSHQITYIATDLYNQTSKCEFIIHIKPAHRIGGVDEVRKTSSSYQQINHSDKRLENHESYLLCPNKPALKIETNYPLQLPPGCYIKNVRIKHYNRRRHNLTQNNMLRHYSSWDNVNNKRMLAFHSFHHRGWP